MSNLRDLARVGHWPSLIAALAHFEVSFAVWMLPGALAPLISADLGLSARMTGLMVATPLLAGAAWRVALGWLADAWGPRRVGTVSMLLVFVPLTWGWLGARGAAELLPIGLLLGLAGASFAVSLPLASSHYPPAHRGLALGIAGAGNSGTIIAGLFGPRLAEHVGWHGVFGLALAPVAVAAILFRALAREAPTRKRRPSEVFAPLRESDCWWLCGLYAVSFGGFVGLAGYLPTLLVSKYAASPVLAGTIAAAAAGSGSLLRPVGGLLSDRIGGTRVLAVVYLVAAALAIGLAAAPTIALAAVAAVGLLGILGSGNGAVFQLASVRYSSSMGVVTGLVGAAGGIGGFLLPAAFGFLWDATGSYMLGLGLFAIVSLAAAPSAASIRLRWSRRAEHGLAEAVI